MKETTPETPDKKDDVKLSEKKYLRMKKGSVILSVLKHRIDDFKRLGFTEI
jgi:hypothetical protein